MYIKKDKYNDIRSIVLRNMRDNGYTEEVFFDTKEPFLYNLKEAVEFAKDYLALNDDTTITIIGDYDVDGICATEIMRRGLCTYIAEEGLKAAVNTRLPRRFSEGYGLSEKIVDEIDSGLVITVDNGIASFYAIKKAKNKGLSVIITDHHLPPIKNGKMVLPDADVILDPHIDPLKSDFEDYCGAGLAYRFVKLLNPNKKFLELLSLASIATVADIIPLYGANREMVRNGLELFNHLKVVPGLKNLMIKLSIADGHATEDDYGFKIGPTFNASGRLFDNGAERVLRLLKMDYDDPKIPFKANNLIKTNEERKAITKKDMERVLEHYDGKRPIVIHDEEIGEGIIGLVAGRMTESYHSPSIVFTKTEKEGIIKGSGRSIPEINLKEVLDKIQDKIVGYGGHAGAAGLSIELSKLDDFKDAFEKACGEIPELSKDVYYDMELEVNEIPMVVQELNSYAPYGEKNPKILFHMKYEVNPEKFTRIGDGTHFMIKDDVITIMGFGKADEYEKKGKPSKLDCVGYLSESWYNGNCSYKFELVSFND